MHHFFFIPSLNRCMKCLTKIYCSEECRLLNKEKHKEFCQEGARVRKTMVAW